LVRRGDKVSAPDTAPLLIPNSCQHCKNPACMIDCPTGAIGRDARGEVFIREDLCTGCGSCAKACPWENISMAPTKATKYPLVAVKCDLCSGLKGGPACVNSCPTEAIARIDPNVALVPGRADVLPPRTAAWPWISGAALAAVGLAAMSVGRWPTGIAAGVLTLLLIAYSGAKRLRVRLSSRYLYIAHMALGTLLLGVSVAHVGARIPPNVAGALALSLLLTVVTGALGGVFAVLIPPALSRLERKSVLPEELAARAKELDSQVFRALSGKSELVKTLYVQALRPYLRSRLGPFALLASRRTLRAEEKRLRARLDALTGKPKTDAALDDLVRLVVEHRAVRVQRWLTLLLRGWLAPHLAATAAVVILMVLHVVGVVR
jgi:Fe-S-cluster-containing hydrogenase component 2